MTRQYYFETINKPGTGCEVGQIFKLGGPKQVPIERVVRSACTLCESCGGVLFRVAGDKVVGIEGDPENQINRSQFTAVQGKISSRRITA